MENVNNLDVKESGGKQCRWLFALAFSNIPGNDQRGKLGHWKTFTYELVRLSKHQKPRFKLCQRNIDLFIFRNTTHKLPKLFCVRLKIEITN